MHFFYEITKFWKILSKFDTFFKKKISRKLSIFKSKFKENVIFEGKYFQNVCYFEKMSMVDEDYRAKYLEWT